MPKMNLFGELEYTDEELKEMKKKEAEEKAKKEAEAKAQEEAKKAAAELKKKIKDKKKEIIDKFNELILDADTVSNEESMASIEEAKEQVDTLDTLLDLDNLWKPFDASYNAMKAVAKQKEKEKKEKEDEAKAKKYKYPFLMYFGHEYRDVTGVFEEGKSYSETALTKTLVEHGFKDFKYAQEIQWEYFEDENCLYPKFKLGNRG